MKNKSAWRYFAKALGEKASKCDQESDRIALIRTFIFATYLITNSFIIAGVVKHWNDSNTHYEVPSNLQQTKEERLLKTNRNFAYD